LPRSKSRATSRPPVETPDERTPLLRRIPWVPVAITLAIFVSAAFAVPAVRDAATLGHVDEAALSTPPAYLALAPISSILDTLTLLTVGQHIAVGLWVIGTFIAIRVWRARKGTTIRRELTAALLLLVGIVVTYGAGAILPRPMAQLAVSDLNVLSIDFHAHTRFSHDGRAGWTEEAVRNWYRAAGFDVAYITDHRTFEGAERGIAANPPLAGQGTMLLQGLEAFYRGEHVNVLSAGRRYKGLTTPDTIDIDPQAAAMASLLVTAAPVMIETVPGNLSKVPAANDSGHPGVMAIEIVDGAPRGLSQTRRERARIIKIADSLNLALVTGTDNHGWGRAAPGWTLMRIPGWRGMGTDSLSRRIEDILRAGGREATRPVERRIAGGQSPASLAFAGPLVAWRMLTTLGPDERVMWIVWTWGIVVVARGLRRYRLRPSATA
jgi:hypothetical protein